MEKRTEGTTFNDLLELVRRLRGPEGCPWDREQEIQDLKSYLLEECYEVLEAVNSTSFEKLQEELGDLLFQVAFMVELAEERKAFSLQDVLQGIHAKMIRRHPHVFGDKSVQDADAVRDNWFKIKQAEGTTPASLLGSVPRHLPALQRAYRLSQRASQAGLDWTGPEPVLEKVREEIRELEDALQDPQDHKIQEEIGDILFTLANLARHLKLNPEETLQESNRKFLERFQRLEQRAVREGRCLEDLSPEEMDCWWEEIKETSGDAGSRPRS